MFKTNVKRLLSISMVLMMLLSFAACGGITGGKTVDLGKYVTVKYSGIDGKGRADFDFDSDALALHLINNCSKQFKKVVESKDIDLSEVEIAEYADIIASGFYAEGDGENLSNGDKVTARVAFDGSLQAIEEELGVKFENAVVEFTVSDLKDATELDVFENLDIKFEGVSPELNVSFSEKEAGKYGFYVTYSLNGGYYGSYKIGDTLNVVAKFNDADAEAKGYVVTSKEKSIVIEESMVESYIKDPSLIHQDVKTIIRNDVDSKAQALLVDKDLWGSVISGSVNNLSFHKAYLAYSDIPGLKDGPMGGKAYNFICMVYKYNPQNDDGTVSSDYVYEYLYLCNVSIKDNQIKYDVSKISDNGEEFATETDLTTYLTNYGYTYTEIQNF